MSLSAEHKTTYASVDEPRAMCQPSKPAEKRLAVLPGQFDGFRGWMVLTNASGEFSSNHDKGRGVHRRPHPEAVIEIYSGGVRDDGSSTFRRWAAIRGLEAQVPMEDGAGCCADRA